MLGATLSARDYLHRVRQEIDRLDVSQLETLSQLIETAYHDGRFVFLIGNGGSGANASHLCEDLAKCTLRDFESQKRLKILSLTDNTPWVTAVANDISYEHFSFYNYIFHYFIPILMTVDYIFFVDKTDMHWYSIFTWMIYPAFYVVFVYFRAWVTIVTHGKSHLYPYTFMDPNFHGPLEITRGVLIVGAQFFIIGVFVYAVGMGLFYLGIPPLSWTYNG